LVSDEKLYAAFLNLYSNLVYLGHILPVGWVRERFCPGGRGAHTDGGFVIAWSLIEQFTAVLLRRDW